MTMNPYRLYRTIPYFWLLHFTESTQTPGGGPSSVVGHPQQNAEAPAKGGCLAWGQQQDVQGRRAQLFHVG